MAIMQDAELRIVQYVAPLISEKDPKKAIQKYIELPFIIQEEEYDYWRLQFKLKWNKEYFNPEKMKPVTDKLTDCFQELGYENPAEEASLLNCIIDAISINILRKGIESQQALPSLLLKKYKL